MGHRTNDRSFFESAPNGFSVADVTVRLAESRERVQRDATVNRHHYLVQDSPTLAEHPLQGRGGLRAPRVTAIGRIWFGSRHPGD